MRTRLIHLCASAVLLASPAIAAAQVAAKPAAAPPPAAAPATPAAVTPAPAPAAQPATEPYSYNPDGRRDPFVSLIARGLQTDSTGRRMDGLAGVMTGELVMTGILQSKGAYTALVKAPDGKTFKAHVNDRLADGTIRTITPKEMVIMQEVNDPLSLVKVKEVRKGLRASDDVKQ
jgi:type IV pilus assembly protein PilP